MQIISLSIESVVVCQLSTPYKLIAFRFRNDQSIVEASKADFGDINVYFFHRKIEIDHKGGKYG